MKRTWATRCAVAIILLVVVGMGRAQTIGAADDQVALTVRAVAMWNEIPEPFNGMDYGGEDGFADWQNDHPADHVIALGHVLHVFGLPDVVDSAGPRFLIAAYRAAFPDLVLTAGAPIVEGNRVTVHWRMRGTFLGAFAGLQPTGESYEEAGTFVFRIAGRQIVETWVNVDTVATLLRTGATPVTTPSPLPFYRGDPADPSRDDPYYTGA